MELVIIVFVIITIAIIFMAVLGALYEGIFSIIYPIYDYFFHTRWGLLAVVFFVLSFIFGFYSKRLHEHVVLKDEIMDSLKLFISDISNKFKSKSTNKLLSKNNNTLMENRKSESLVSQKDNLNVIDMSKMNIDGVLKSLAKSINKPNPILLKGWSNKSLRLDVERVNIFTNYIQSIRGLGNEFLELQADAIFSHDRIKHFLKMREDKNTNELNLLNAETEDLLDKYKFAKEEREQTNELLKTKIEHEKAKTALLNSAVDNWENIKPEHVTIIQTVLNPDSKTDSSYDSIDKDYARMEILLKEKEVNAKEIENLKSDIERKQMNDKYKANKQ